jgi:hypothetical protein
MITKGMIRDYDGKFEQTVSPPDLDDVLEWIKENLEPEDVFEQKKLEEWAMGNGWVGE